MRLHNLLILLTMFSCKTKETKAPQSDEPSKAVFTKEQLIVDGDTLPYRLLLPANYDQNKSYPLVLFLHGAGERGTDNELQLVHGAELFLQPEVRAKYPAIVVFPQCAKEMTWSGYTWKSDGSIDYNLEQIEKTPVLHQILLSALLTELNSNYKLDQQRQYIGGLSMGGMGTFETVRQHPHRFAAAFPICGGAPPQVASELTTPRWWIFHGAEDQVVLPENSTKIHDAMKALDINAKLSLYPGVGHDSWTNAFAEPELLEWLFGQHL